MAPANGSVPRVVIAAIEHEKSVLPVGLNKKALVPWTSLQTVRATLDQVEQWQAEFHPPAWAIVTGQVSRIAVGDFDGILGLETAHKYGIRFHTSTPSGGGHQYLQHPGFWVPTISSTTKAALKEILPGFDVRGDGGYVVFCGRNTEGVYKRLRPLSQPDPWAGELIDKLMTVIGEQGARRDSEQQPLGGFDRGPVHAGGVSAEELLATYLEKERNGAARNDNGLQLALQLRDNGFSQDEAASVMLRYAHSVKDTDTKGRHEPYTEAEALATVRSVYSRPPREPWGRTNGRMADPPPPPPPETPWPEPEPLDDVLPQVMPFDMRLVPDSFRPLISDVSERMQVPPDFPAVGSLVCLAGVGNRRVSIQPKAHDAGWVIWMNLWGGIIALPGFLKSPVLRAITALVFAIERLWRMQYEAELDEFEGESESAELRLAAWKEQSKAAFKKGEVSPLRPDTSLRKPTQKRLIIGDATFEKQHELMAENPNGLLIVRDELSGWLSQLDKPGREGERAFNLECWNGDSSHTIDRIGRGSIFVPACCTSMLGGITPARLRAYLTEALEDRPGNDGLLQRFQVMVWPDCPQNWEYIDRPPNAAAEQQVARIFQKLAEMDPDSPVRLRFAPDAQELFIAWLSELEGKIRGDNLHPALVSHLAKYRRLMPAIAGLWELADGIAGNNLPETISLKQAQRAAAWIDYLESHARRIYSCAITPQLRAAHELARKIKDHKVEASFSCRRDVYLKGWSGLTSPELVRQAAEILEDANWIRRLADQPNPTGGRPPDRYAVNPRVYE